MSLEKAEFLRFFSDIHLDFQVNKRTKGIENLWTPSLLKTDKDTVLVLAGDIWHAKKAFYFMNESWMKKIASQFKYVVFVLGNHDYWSGNLSLEPQRILEYIYEQGLDNVFLLQNSSIKIGNYKFLGTTLWTDYFNKDPYCIDDAVNHMNDFKYIKYHSNYYRLRASTILEEYEFSKNYIFKNAVKESPEEKICVVTHHPPSFYSSNNKQEELDLATLPKELGIYYSNLNKEIERSEIDLWIHGHNHLISDYKINQTRILSNPKGYPEENLTYREDWLIPLS